MCGHARLRYMHTPAGTFSKHFPHPSAQKSLYPHLYTHTSMHAHYWFANQGHHPQIFFWNWWKMQFNHVLANLDRFDPFWTDLIHFGQIWSILDRFDPFWTIWSILDRFDPFWTDFICFGQIWSISDRFDPSWTDLIHFGQIWSNLMKKGIVIFILMVQSTMYSTELHISSKSL